MDKKTLTVFTPTYNRAHTIGRTYESLCRQTCKDFEWLVIDDGSTDNTKALVQSFIDERIIPVQYVYKENGGLHTGYNRAIELAETELIVCIDSDDFMPNTAVAKILEFWNMEGSERYGGIIGLDYSMEGEPLGGKFPNLKSSHIIDLTQKYHYNGDTKVVFRTELLKKVYPQPSFNGEKNFNPIYLMLMVDADFEFLLLNENLCYVDYQEDGMAANIYKQYVNSPNSFAALRILQIKLPTTSYAFKLRQYIHLSASIWLSGNFTWLFKAPCLLLSIFFLPFGYLLSMYIKNKAK